MTRRPAFTQADIARAIKALEKAGKTVAGVDFPPAGGFRLLIGAPSGPLLQPGDANEWDVVLPKQ